MVRNCFLGSGNLLVFKFTVRIRLCAPKKTYFLWFLINIRDISALKIRVRGYIGRLRQRWPVHFRRSRGPFELFENLKPTRNGVKGGVNLLSENLAEDWVSLSTGGSLEDSGWLPFSSSDVGSALFSASALSALFVSEEHYWLLLSIETF